MRQRKFYVWADVGGHAKHAGPKARKDVVRTATLMGIRPFKCGAKSSKILTLIEAARQAIVVGLFLRKDDSIVVQYPPLSKATQLVYKILCRQCHTTALVHDLASERAAAVSLADEVAALNRFRTLIVPTHAMRDKLLQHGVTAQISVMSAFDYYIAPDSHLELVSDKSDIEESFKTVIFAGNLAREKSSFLYGKEFNSIDARFVLFGENYALSNKPVDDESSNTRWNGSFSPDSPSIVGMDGFGLVWDGKSAETCSGATGDYLKVNYSHKLSLYLASGIPVLVWREAAAAEFVRETKCGILIDSLHDIPEIVQAVERPEYLTLRQNAMEVGAKLRAGYYLRATLGGLFPEVGTGI